MDYNFYLMNHTGYTMVIPAGDQFVFLENGRSLKTTFRPELKALIIDNTDRHEIQVYDEFVTFEGHTVICYKLYG